MNKAVPLVPACLAEDWGSAKQIAEVYAQLHAMKPLLDKRSTKCLVVNVMAEDI
jgi:hypothetical protein